MPPFAKCPNLLIQGSKSLPFTPFPAASSGSEMSDNHPQILTLPGLTCYPDALAALDTVLQAVKEKRSPEAIMLLEHPPIYTGGTSAQDSDLLAKTAIETVSTGRGGQWTYHGPGQRIIWPILDLQKRRQDVRLYVYQLEGWMIDVLASFGIEGLRREGLPGIWVKRRDIGLSDRLDKIVAIGVRISRWVTSHGIAFNLDPELAHYDGIVPCGVTDGGITSLADLGLIISQAELDMAIQDCFGAHFGPTSPLAVRS